MPLHQFTLLTDNSCRTNRNSSTHFCYLSLHYNTIFFLLIRDRHVFSAAAFMNMSAFRGDSAFIMKKKEHGHVYIYVSVIIATKQ